MADSVEYNVIHTWRRGSTSYMYGASNSGTRVDTWNCGTIDSSPFSACYPNMHSWGYILITKSLYDSLTDDEKAIARARSHGMVDGSYWYTAPWADYSGRVWQVVYLRKEALVECWTDLCFDLRPDLTPDPCDGVVCDPECAGVDLYDNVCDDGICVRGSLIEENSVDCGYIPPDPCEGVICNPECVGNDMYNTVCEDGICAIDTLIEEDSIDCGYVPPLPDPDENMTDILMNNKEIILGAIVAGVLLVKYA